MKFGWNDGGGDDEHTGVGIVRMSKMPVMLSNEILRILFVC